MMYFCFNCTTDVEPLYSEKQSHESALSPLCDGITIYTAHPTTAGQETM
jgi:hypothetical protein